MKVRQGMHLGLDDKMAGQKVVGGKVRERASEVFCKKHTVGTQRLVTER